MKIMKTLEISLLSIVLLAISLVNGKAQTTATWIGPASGGEWNTAANWNTGAPPLDSTTNAVIGVGTNVSYNLPMAAASFGVLTNNGVLNVNTNGFNCSAISMINPAGGDRLFITNSGAAVTVSGNLTMGTNSSATLGAGASLTVNALNVDNGTSSKASGTSTFTNSGGTLVANSTSVNNGSGTGTGLLVISGGTNTLGATVIGRYNSSGVSTPGTEGLAIYGGQVTMSNLNAGNSGAASYLTAYIAGGTVTNFGSVFINNATAGRYSRVLQTGGLFVVPDPGVVNPNSTVAGTVTSIYSVTGGTNIVGGFFFGNSNTLVAATAYFTNGAVIYVGSQGIATNGASINTIFLKGGGMFGATANWTGSAPMSLGSGTFTFQAADMNGNPNNITLLNPLTGLGGTLNKTGGGALLLSATNTYSGSTLVNGGTLALGANGSIASPIIFVGSGTVFDVSAVSGGFVLTNQTLAGSGVVTGAVSVASGATINPGSNALNGTLSFSNSVTETGGAINHFDLAGTPNPNNDFVIIAGDFDVSGTNSVDIAGASLVAGTNYTLIHYGGNFNGGLTNFIVTSTIGTLSNNATAKTISFIPHTTLRGPTNTVWVGNPLNTNWDNEVTTNWLKAGVLDFFVPGDSVQFTDAGATNSPVNIVGEVLPGSVLVNSHSNYVFASTSGGWIGGAANLTVTNTGTLTLWTTNTYTGNTTIDGGSALAVSQLAIGGSPSAVGESDSLVINNGTFIYSGPTVSIDRGATLGTASSAINVSTNGTLTLGGNLVGNGGLTTIGPGTLILNGSSSYAGVATLSNGILQVNGSAALGANNVNFDGGTLSFESQSSQNFFANTFNALTTGTMIFNGANADNIIGSTGGDGGFSGTGTLNIDIPNAAGYCTINAHMDNFAGTIHVTDDSLGTFRFDSGGSSSSAQECTGGTNATFDLGNSFVTLLNRNGGGASYGTYYLGALAGGTNATLRGSANAGSASTYQIGDKNLSTTFSGTITNGTGGAGATVAITKTGTGTLTLNGDFVVTVTLNGVGEQITNYSLGNPITYTGPTTVSNGVLALVTPVILNNSPTVTLASATAVLNASQMGYISNALDGDPSDPLFGTSTNYLVTNGLFEVVSGQTLAGIGTIQGQMLADAGSTLNVGLPAGSLTVINGIELAGAVNLNINAAGSPNCSEIVSPSFTIDSTATLTVNNLGPENAATFQLFNHPVSFTSVVLPTLTGTNSWVNNLAVDGTIILVAPQLVTVNTNSPYMTNTFDGTTLTLSWPADRIGSWRLQSQTNTTSVGLWTNWVEVTGASATNKVILTVDKTKGTVFYRLIYP